MSRSGTWSKLWLVAAVMFAGLLRATPAHAQGATITGRVESDLGQPLEAANVFITELNVSVGTTAQGRYTITIPAARVSGQQVVLRVRAIGYLAATTPITLTNGTITHDFTVKRDINRLDEVVVTGMSVGTEQKKTPFTISAVTQQDMPVPEASALTGLEGKVPGAQIVTPSGRPGTSAVAILRGPHSIDGTNVSQSPLIIVDGVMLSSGNGNSAGTGSPSTIELNDEDIESIEVVKGAAASSLYGSRAGNGVISITTKNAKNAAPGIKFSVRSELGWQDVAKEYPNANLTPVLMNETGNRICLSAAGQPDCYRTVDWQTEALRVNGQGGVFALAPYAFGRDFGLGAPPTQKNQLQGYFQQDSWATTYDPVREGLTQGLINTDQVDATGKFGSTGFYTSFSNLSQQGTAKYELGFRRQGARVNLDGQPGGAFSTQVQTYYARTTNFPDFMEWFYATRQPPAANLLARDDKGRLYIRSDIRNGGSQNYNPLYDASCCYGRDDGDRFLGTINSKYTATSWLDFDGSASIDRGRESNAQLQDIGYRTTATSTGAGPLNAGNGGNLGGIYDQSQSSASYNVALDGIARHNFGSDVSTRFTARYTYDQQDASQFTASGNTLTVPGLLSIANAQIQNTPSTSQSSIRALGFSANENISYKDRYIIDALARRDGSSLFGAANRWDTYGRASFAYRISDESWWMLPRLFDDFKLRASVGSAGGRPAFANQYETFTIGTGGSVTAGALGNKNLKPEYTLETEYGVDAEIFNKYGLTFNYARDITRNQILAVPPSVSSGFSSQYQNAGTMDGKTYEVSLRVPLYTGKQAVLSSTINWDSNREYITAMNIPPFASAPFVYQVGQRYGNFFGKRFITNCDQLDPADGFSDPSLCGAGKPWQPNNEGYIVWVGCSSGSVNPAIGTFQSGHLVITQKASSNNCVANSSQNGITGNLWQTSQAGCSQNVGTAAAPVWAPLTGSTGTTVCLQNNGAAGTTFGVSTPFGQPRDFWGMLTDLRDTTANPVAIGQPGTLLGNALPLWRLTFSPTFQYKKLTIFANFDHSHGNKVYNQDLQWSFGDFQTNLSDQTAGKTVQTAKPLGYYWRAPSPDNSAGTGGYYDVLGTNNISVENATYTKLREVSVSWQIGHVPGVIGDWTVSGIARNIMTITGYNGWDPEIGTSGGTNGSAAISAEQINPYPPSRTFTIALQSRF